MQSRRILIADLLQQQRRPHCCLRQCRELGLFDFPRRRRDRRAVRIVARLAECIRHPLDQLFGHRMLEPLGFDVHVTPVVTKFAGEIGFEDAMAANHLQRGAATLRCELHAAIRHMLDEPRFRETLHHAAHGWRSDVEHFGDVAGGREAALTGEVENRL